MACAIRRFYRVVMLLATVGFIVANAQIVVAQDDDGAAAEEAQQIAVAKRFLTVLEKTPRRGTALDRVYGHHVEFGTLAGFLDELRERVKKGPGDGDGWMLLGLFESHRGEDASAAEADRKSVV